MLATEETHKHLELKSASAENSVAVQDLFQINIFEAYKLNVLLKDKMCGTKKTSKATFSKLTAAKIMIQPCSFTCMHCAVIDPS